jgi:hypothetical protein
MGVQPVRSNEVGLCGHPPLIVVMANGSKRGTCEERPQHAPTGVAGRRFRLVADMYKVRWLLCSMIELTRMSRVERDT